ncbi:phage terminase small subunit, partial [Clostridium perfringens]
KAMKTLEGLINSYEKLLNTNWDLASEEQKTRVEKLKAEVNKLDGTNENTGPIEIVIKRKGED